MYERPGRQECPIRCVRVGCRGTRKWAPGGDRRRARPGRAVGGGGCLRDRAERRDDLAPSTPTRQVWVGTITPRGKSGLLSPRERPRGGVVGGCPRRRCPSRG